MFKKTLKDIKPVTPSPLEQLYTSPEEFLESITQKIQTHLSIYNCIDCHVLPTITVEDEYVLVVLEIMSKELQAFYGGRYLVQHWTKKRKVFQAVHSNKPNNFYLHEQRYMYSLQGTDDECSYLYIINLYQSIYQKIKHPLFSAQNEDGIHDQSVYIDTKQAAVTLDTKLLYAKLKMEEAIKLYQDIEQSIQEFRGDEQAKLDEKQPNYPQLEAYKELLCLETNAQFRDVFEQCYQIDKPQDIFKIHCVSSEGFCRKELNFLVETETDLIIMKLEKSAHSEIKGFLMSPIFTFEKEKVDVKFGETIKQASLKNIADRENLVTIIKSTGEMKVMSENIMKLIIEYQSSVKQQEEEEDEDSDEEEHKIAIEKYELTIKTKKWYQKAPRPVPPFAQFKVERQKQKEKATQIAAKAAAKLSGKKVQTENKKSKDAAQIASNNNVLSNITNFMKQEIKDNIFQVENYFMRRDTLYIMSNKGQVRKVQISKLVNQDPINKTILDNTPSLQAALLQDVTMHIGFLTDFLMANTTLIISHGKILSIFDFLTNQWRHMLPFEQGNQNQTWGQTYFGMPSDEIESLMLNYIFPNSIYDCIIKYKGQFIRRLKYYTELNKTYFEKAHMFESQKVIQMITHNDSKNYRLYGDSTTRTFFLVEDDETKEQAIWVSENGSRITLLVNRIKDKWRILCITNAPSEMLPIYSETTQTLTIYNIHNSRTCFYPHELSTHKLHEMANYSYDPTVYHFYFNSKLYFNQKGNLIVYNFASKNPLKSRVELNFNKSIKDFYMTHQDTVYFLDKSQVFRFAHLEMQVKFNIDKQPTEVFMCKGAFCDKIEYGTTMNRLALFTSPFEISIIPSLDRCRIDLVATQDFEKNFICWKEKDNVLTALKRPNKLVSWNLDNGKIIEHKLVEGIDFTHFNKHSDWNGLTILKELKSAHLIKDDSGDTASGDNLEEEKAKRNNPHSHLFSVVEIKSETQIVEHARFLFDLKLGQNIYISDTYVLVMDDNHTKMFQLEGKGKFKTLKQLHNFYEPQMKLGKPTYFSPNFLHRLYIDPNTKELILNYTLTNQTIMNLNITSQLLFQKEKTHPMIYFHENDKLVYLTSIGIEKVFEIVKIPGKRRKKETCTLKEISNCFYNDQALIRRFIMDNLSFNNQYASQLTKTNLLKFRADILKRYLLLNIYTIDKTDSEKSKLSRFFKDYNTNSFSHFIVNNYRRELSFNYLTWKVINAMANKKMVLQEFNDNFSEELSFTILPDHKTILHKLTDQFEALDHFLAFVNKDDPLQENQKLTISEIPFIPDLENLTPLHYSVKSNNTRVTDVLVSVLSEADFDHHIRFLIELLPKFVEQVPQSLCTYLDKRMKTTKWVADYTRGRIEPDNDCSFVMTTQEIWHQDLDQRLASKLYNQEVLEVPLTMYIVDLPEIHKFQNKNASEFLEALSQTENIELFNNLSVQAMIEFKWPKIKTAIKRALFYPYLVFLLCFLVYSVWIFETLAINTEDVGWNWRSSAFWINNQKQILKVVILACAGYFALLELRQLLICGPYRYFASPWNYIDIIPLLLITFSMLFEYIFHFPELERPLNAISCFFMWIKFLYFLRIFRQTSKFIKMIEAIIADTQVFMAVFFITIIAFSQSLYIMSNNNYDPETAGNPSDHENPDQRFIHSLMDSIFFAYRMSLGDFDTGALGEVHLALVQITVVLATLFLTIVMLNLLIAVISDTYSRVEESSMNELYKTLADLICENEFLVSNSSLKEQDDEGDYLYIACVDKNDNDGEVWESKLTNLKSKMVTTTVGIERMIREAQHNLVGTISTQGEKFLSMLLESNIKNDMRMRQYQKKVESLNKKEERTETIMSSPDRYHNDMHMISEEGSFFGQMRIGEQSPDQLEKKGVRPGSRQAKRKSQDMKEEEQKTISQRATMKRS